MVVARRRLGQGAAVRLGMFYLGAAAALPAWLDPSLWLISGALTLAFALALLGWRSLGDWGDGSRYLAFAVTVSILAGLSSLWAWDTDSMYAAFTFGVWLVFIVPGLVGLARDDQLRRALIFGLVAGTVVYGIVAAIRIASGESVLDQPVGGRGPNNLFGLNRNAVNMRAAIIAPFLADWVRRKPRSVVRWSVLVSVTLAVLASGGRAGLVAVAAGLLTLALLQPDVGRRMRAILVVLMVGTVVASGFRGTDSALGAGIDRIVSYVHGERTGSDEARDLLVDKAWAVAKENPVLGIGLQNFRGVDHPIALEGSSSRIRHTVHAGVAHNTYAQTLAELGFVGGFAVFAFLAWVLVQGIRFSRLPEVRPLVAGLAGLLVVIFFDSALASSVLFLSLVLALGVVFSVRASSAPGVSARVLASADRDL